MIGKVLVFLKDQLNAYLEMKSSKALDAPEKEDGIVVFLDGGSADSLTFKKEAVTAILINIEEDTTLRPADLYTMVDGNGAARKVQPEIRMNLYVLFVARFSQYETGLDHLSSIIRYFQSNRVFSHHNAPALDEEIEKLIVELITLPFSEQNEIWNALRSHYLPSVLYKVKMIVFRDEDMLPIPEMTEKIVRIAE